jgi:hypothetical protein
MGGTSRLSVRCAVTSDGDVGDIGISLSVILVPLGDG